MVGAEHSDTGSKLRASERHHVLSDVSSDSLSMLRSSVVEDPLNQVVAILVAGNVNERDSSSISPTFADTIQIPAQEITTPDLETLLHHFGSKLIGAVLGSISNHMVNGPAAVRRAAVLTDVLDAPIAELPMSDNVDVGEDLLNAGALSTRLAVISKAKRSDSSNLVVFEAVLEDILYDQASCLTKSHLMPHALERLVHILHDLRRGLCPAKLEQLLPDVACITVDHCLRDATEQLIDHDCLVVLWDRVEGFLDHMATKWVHGQIEGMATDRFGDLDHLFGRPVLKAALNEEIAESVHHQGVCLGHNSLDNLVLLLRSSNLQLLLQEDRCLLIIVANDLVDDVLPVAIDVPVKKTTVVERLSWRKICWATISAKYL